MSRLELVRPYMKKSIFLLAFAVVAVAAVSSSAFGQNIVVNGSFESETNLLNANPGATYGVLGTDPAPDGWTFTASDLTNFSYSESNGDSSRPSDPVTGNSVNAQDGNWYVSFGAYNVSGASGPTSEADYDSLSQVLSTTVGQTYNLTYYVYALGGSGNTFSGDYFNATWDGVVVNGSQISDNQTSFGGWVKYSLNVTGTGSDTLALNGFNNTTFVNVDNVSVVAQSVPEPASFAALGFGLIGLVARRRRK